MVQIIRRYSLTKENISTGTLTVSSKGQVTTLTFKDPIIEVTVRELYHPLMALESLRRVLEIEHKSLLGCNGCRIDTSYRATGGYGTYKTVPGQQATEILNIFEPTNDIEKLCTVEEHKAAYQQWIDNLNKIKKPKISI